MSIDNYGDLYLSPTDSDVTLIVEETQLPAHRLILSKRSEYFNAMFSSNFVESNFDKIELKGTNANTFKRVLKYIYTGNVECLCVNRNSLLDAFELLCCARYYMVENMVSAMIEYIKEEGVHYSFLVLSKALADDIDELVSFGTELVKNQKVDDLFIDVFKDLSPLAVDHLLKIGFKEKVANIYDAMVYWMQCNPGYSSTFIKWFEQLSPLAVEYFLELHYISSELKIFKVLVLWIRRNPTFSSTFSDLLKHIDLYLLKKVHLDTLFKPTQLIDPIFVQNLLSQQREEANKVQKIVNQNVINDIKDLRIVCGNVIRFNTSNTRKVTHSNGSIIIDLKKQFLLNCLKLTLMSGVCYTLSVSKDMRDWERVIDRSKCDCFGQQVLHFKERSVRFIQIRSAAGFLHIDANLEALYSTDPI